MSLRKKLLNRLISLSSYKDQSLQPQVSVIAQSSAGVHQGETTPESTLVAEGGARDPREYKRLVLAILELSLCLELQL